MWAPEAPSKTHDEYTNHLHDAFLWPPRKRTKRHPFITKANSPTLFTRQEYMPDVWVILNSSYLGPDPQIILSQRWMTVSCVVPDDAAIFAGKNNISPLKVLVTSRTLPSTQVNFILTWMARNSTNYQLRVDWRHHPHSVTYGMVCQEHVP